MKSFEKQCQVSQTIEILRILCSKPEYGYHHYNSKTLINYYGIKVQKYDDLYSKKKKKARLIKRKRDKKRDLKQKASD